MYILRRHGIPNQLLQHLLTVADHWLEEKAALELWVDSSCPSSLSVFTVEGSSWRTLWPVEWDNDVALYLAAMKRMVSRLASMTSFCDQSSSVAPEDLEWKLSISRHNKLPLTLFPNDPDVVPVMEWVVPPPDNNHNTDTDDNSNASFKNARKIGKILVRLQGSIHPIAPTDQDYLKQSHDVSLVFEANFDVTDDDLQDAGT